MTDATPAAAALIRTLFPLRLAAWVDGRRVRIGHGHVVQPRWDCQEFHLPPQALATLCTDAVIAGRLSHPLTVDRSAADAWLAQDLLDHARFIQTVTGLRLRKDRRPLTSGQFDALCVLIHLTSQGQYATSRLRRDLEAGELAQAAERLIPWPALRVRFLEGGSTA